MIIDHSFVKDTARDLDFMSSEHFKEFFRKIDTNKDRSPKHSKASKANLMQNLRRKSMLSNFNIRTYKNSETVLQELNFGPFIVRISTFKSPLDHEYMIALIFEKNLKRKVKLDKRTFMKYAKKLNRKQEEQNSRNDKYF